MHKPLILLAGHLEVNPGRTPIIGQKEAYVDAVLRAGGLPLIAPQSLPIEDRRSIIALADGFMLCGGGDMDPALYGKKPCPNLFDIDPQRDAFELDLCLQILAADKPLLAICRGVQVMNVALGGSLICDIASELPDAMTHNYFDEHPRDFLAHTVAVSPGTRLAELLEKAETPVNSLHHQTLDQLGQGLIVNARSSDGLVEGVEMPGKRFVLGLQWHPECLPGLPEMQQIFSAFVASANAD